MKKILLASFLLIGFNSFAQQLHFTSQYIQHNSMYNAGAAGIANDDMVGLSYRNQWSSFPGNPRTYMIYGDFNLDKISSGIGTYIYRDETGPTSRTGLQFAFSKHVKSQTSKNQFGFGVELRGLQYAIDKGKISESLPNDPVLNGDDKKFVFDAGAGAYFTNEKLSIGAGASQLIQSKLKLSDVPGSKTPGQLYRHYNFNANYKINGGGDIYIIPHAMVRVIEHSPTEFDLGAFANYQEKVWWGLTWRVQQAWSLQAGFKLLQRVALTYAYDYYEKPINVFTKGSGAHELGLKFELGKKPTSTF